MTGLGILALALLAAVVGSELALRGTKLQTGLSRVLGVWAVVWLPALYALFRSGEVDPVTFTIFWGGAFLSSFGVRSHIESSILLRMLYLLRKRPMTEAQVLDEYASLYGEAMRLEELLRGGMATKVDGRQVVTPKGKAILNAVARLR